MLRTYKYIYIYISTCLYILIYYIYIYIYTEYINMTSIHVQVYIYACCKYTTCNTYIYINTWRHWRRSLGSLKCPSRSLHHLLPDRGAPRLWLQTRQSESPSPVEHAARTLRPARPSATIAAASKAERLPMCLRTETFHADRVVKDWCPARPSVTIAALLAKRSR